jgi:hypothetical protein
MVFLTPGNSVVWVKANFPEDQSGDRTARATPAAPEAKAVNPKATPHIKPFKIGDRNLDRGAFDEDRPDALPLWVGNVGCPVGRAVTEILDLRGNGSILVILYLSTTHYQNN